MRRAVVIQGGTVATVIATALAVANADLVIAIPIIAGMGCLAIAAQWWVTRAEDQRRARRERALEEQAKKHQRSVEELQDLVDQGQKRSDQGFRQVFREMERVIAAQRGEEDSEAPKPIVELGAVGITAGALQASARLTVVNPPWWKRPYYWWIRTKRWWQR